MTMKKKNRITKKIRNNKNKMKKYKYKIKEIPKN